MPMFHRIEMDVIDMTPQIDFVADLMLPESPLPQAAFAFRNPGPKPGSESEVSPRFPEQTQRVITDLSG